MAIRKKKTAEPAPKAAVVSKPKPKRGASKFVIDFDAFNATADWPLYTVSTYVRAKQLTEDVDVDGKPGSEGQYVVVTRDRKVSIVDADKFEAEYETVKGPHKQAF